MILAPLALISLLRESESIRSYLTLGLDLRHLVDVQG